jgi:hypothetical protein
MSNVLTLHVVVLPDGTVPFSSIDRWLCDSYVEVRAPEAKVQTTQFLSDMLFKAETYDQFAGVASDVMERFRAAGFGKPGEANTFWAMTMAAIDELEDLRKKVAAFTEAAKVK